MKAAILKHGLVIGLVEDLSEKYKTINVCKNGDERIICGLSYSKKNIAWAEKLGSIARIEDGVYRLFSTENEEMEEPMITFEQAKKAFRKSETLRYSECEKISFEFFEQKGLKKWILGAIIFGSKHYAQYSFLYTLDELRAAKEILGATDCPLADDLLSGKITYSNFENCYSHSDFYE